MSEPPPRPYKNSMESLRKNSSTDTEYSLQPYKVIKQSSNETASLTGSFNVDQPSATSFGTDISLDIDVSPNLTVIETNTDVTSEEKPIKVTTFGGVEFRQSSTTMDYARPSFLKKQFSIDQGQFAASGSKNTDVEKGLVQKSCLKPPTIAIQHQQQQPLSQCSSRLSSTLQESSSLSTDESKDDRTIPKISTNLVQDEIAKLSSNIKSSTEEEKAPPYNETMC